jgi:hypothetical protein
MKEVSLAIQAKLGWVALMEDENLGDLEEVRVSKGRQMLRTQKDLPLTTFSVG